MLSSIAGWVEDKATGYLRTGIQAGGTLAGNAVGGVGGLVESAGKNAGQGVSGGIGGVGNYINSYGDGIKRSMSADGPVSKGEKKTAVKSAAPKPIDKAAPALKKAMASSDTAKPKKPTTSTPKPGVQPVKANTAVQRPLSNTATKPQSVQNGSRPKAGAPTNGAVKKPAANTSKPVVNANKTLSNGKVRISPESKPRPTTRSTTRAAAAPANKHSASDPLSIGKNFGDISKTQPKTNDLKSQTGAARKASAADPLAMGDLEKLGRKK